MDWTKDTQTTIAGVVGAAAIFIQWLLSSIFKYNLDVGADVLNAITVLAGVFIAWKVGKPGNTTTTLVLLLLLLLPIAYYPSPAFSQTWKTANQVTVGWDAVTVPSGTVSYKVYVKPETGGTETLATTVTATQATVTFSQEGRYFMGVSSVRTVNTIPIESSTISWSNVATVCQGGVTFGIQYYTPPGAPVNFRTVP